MKVSGSGYYSWLKSVKSKNTFGPRRIARVIKSHGLSCGRKKARTLMKMANITAKQKKKFKVTTDSNHSLPVSPNLLRRNFHVKSRMRFMYLI